MSVNKVILLGNVGRDPQIRYVGTRPLAEIALATNERGATASDGTPIPERTEWHRLVLNGDLAETAEKYIRKGSRIYVEGRLCTRFWEDRNTIKHSVTEIIVEKLELLSRAQ